LNNIGAVFSQDLKVIPFDNEAMLIATDNLTLLVFQEGMLTLIPNTLTVKHIEVVAHSQASTRRQSA